MIAKSLIAVNALAVTSALVAAWAVRGRSSTLLGPVTWHGPRNVRAIALTFDDGPSESTPRLLDLLDEYQAQATFFVCGQNVQRLPGVARDIVVRGHEIANHTHSHAALYLQGRDAIRREVVTAQSQIADTTGVTPRLFRPPFGCRWPGLAAVLQQQNLQLIMWSTIARDWRLAAAPVATRLANAASAGAIFCLHDGRELNANPDISATLGAVRVIIPKLGQNGFRFPTVSQLICPTSFPTPQSTP